jgi:hypothetical protein
VNGLAEMGNYQKGAQVLEGIRVTLGILAQLCINRVWIDRADA